MRHEVVSYFKWMLPRNTDRVPSFSSDEGGIHNTEQTEVNHEISVETVTARGGCSANLTLRRDS